MTERSRVVLVPVEEIVYLKAELKYITIRTVEREYLLEESLTRLEEEFGARFVRVHRNCLVARDFIRGFERRVGDDGDAHWEVLLSDVPEIASRVAPAAIDRPRDRARHPVGRHAQRRSGATASAPGYTLALARRSEPTACPCAR